MSLTTRVSIIALLLLVAGTAVLAAEGRTPVYRCGPITTSGDYIVTRDLSAPGICLDITAPGVHLDLNGFTVDGGGGADPVIKATGADQLTIRNGEVNSGASAVQVTSGQEVTLEDLKIRDTTGAAVLLEEVSNYAVRRNHISNCNGDAILIDGLPLPDGSVGTIENNVISRCAGGVVIFGGEGFEVRHNRLDEITGGDGIHIEQSRGCLLLENTVSNANADGIVLANTHGCKLFDNVVSRAGNNGIALLAPAAGILGWRNVSSQNSANGIFWDGARGHLEGNLLADNGDSGLRFGGSSSGNVYRLNTARGNATAACGGPVTTDFCDDGAGNTDAGLNFVP